METKVTSNRMGNVESSINPSSWSFMSYVSNTVSCCILIRWNPIVYNVSCLHSFLQWITCKVTSLVDGYDFVVNYMYSLNIPIGCQDLWAYLRQHALAFQSKPWLILDEFNAIMSSRDKSRVILLGMGIWMTLVVISGK